jgi:hypothetical protein
MGRCTGRMVRESEQKVEVNGRGDGEGKGAERGGKWEGERGEW